jgi:hypothetical protein
MNTVWLNSMISKWRKFKSLSVSERRIFTRAVSLLPLVSIGCTVLGFRKVASMLLRKSSRCPIDAIVIHDAAKTAKNTYLLTRTASHLPMFRFRCLVRSLVLWHLLLCQGMDAKLQFGVRKNGKNIKAHAWVEYDGVALGESTDLYSTFAPLLDPSEQQAL